MRFFWNFEIWKAWVVLSETLICSFRLHGNNREWIKMAAKLKENKQTWWLNSRQKCCYSIQTLLAFFPLSLSTHLPSILNWQADIRQLGHLTSSVHCMSCQLCQQSAVCSHPFFCQSVFLRLFVYAYVRLPVLLGVLFPIHSTCCFTYRTDFDLNKAPAMVAAVSTFLVLNKWFKIVTLDWC